MLLLVSEYAPTGDQPASIDALVDGFKKGNQFQTLFGVTGSCKPFIMVNIIQALNKPTLMFAHNKTLAGLFNKCVEDLKKDSPLTEVYLAALSFLAKSSEVGIYYR